MTIPLRKEAAGSDIAARGADETAYRTLLRHSVTCAACRAGAPCPAVAELRRAWREARR